MDVDEATQESKTVKEIKRQAVQSSSEPGNRERVVDVDVRQVLHSSSKNCAICRDNPLSLVQKM